MDLLYILINSLALVMGSLLAAASLMCSASWLCNRFCCTWLGPLFLLTAAGGLWLMPSGHSLFLRLIAIFAGVSAGLLYCIEADGERSRQSNGR